MWIVHVGRQEALVEGRVAVDMRSEWVLVLEAGGWIWVRSLLELLLELRQRWRLTLLANELNSIGVVCQDIIMSTEIAHILSLNLIIEDQIGLVDCVFLVIFHLLAARPWKVLLLESVLICLCVIGLVSLAIVGPLVGTLVVVRLTLARLMMVVLANSVLPLLASSELKLHTSLRASVFLVLVF